jgi:hypothetical protein
MIEADYSFHFFFNEHRIQFVAYLKFLVACTIAGGDMVKNVGGIAMGKALEVLRGDFPADLFGRFKLLDLLEEVICSGWNFSKLRPCSFFLFFF